MSAPSFFTYKYKAKITQCIITQMASIDLQRRHQHGDRTNEQTLEYLKLNVKKHVSECPCRTFIRFII